MRTTRTAVLSAVAGIVVSLSATHAALSEGAFAVGSTGDVSKDGIAYGGAYNFPTRQEAEAGALKACRNFKGAPRAAKTCKVVATFKRECYAQANDPKAGTPGTGWAIARDEETAKERALAACQTSAGADRQAFCVVELSRCDEGE